MNSAGKRLNIPKEFLVFLVWYFRGVIPFARALSWISRFEDRRPGIECIYCGIVDGMPVLVLCIVIEIGRMGGKSGLCSSVGCSRAAFPCPCAASSIGAPPRQVAFLTHRTAKNAALPLAAAVCLADGRAARPYVRTPSAGRFMLRLSSAGSGVEARHRAMMALDNGFEKVVGLVADREDTVARL